MITSFFGEYRFLSNFWPCIIEYEGLTFPSVEHAYVAAKTLDVDVRKIVQGCQTAGDAKKLGKATNVVKLRPDWEEVKLPLMTNFVNQKFKDPELRAKLDATKPHVLVEGNNWGDKFWGQCPLGDGKNHLGIILMNIRDNIFNNAS